MKLKVKRQGDMDLYSAVLGVVVELLEDGHTIACNVVPRGTIGYKVRINNLYYFVVIANHVLGAFIIDENTAVRRADFPITLEQDV